MVEVDADACTNELQKCVKVLIQGLGEDCAREGLLDTPLRVAKAYLDLTRGTRCSIDSTLAKAMFKEPVVHRGAGGLVIVKEIEFAGLSEDNLLPFFGVCHIGYIPSDGVVLGLSKFARLVKWQAKRVQNQQAFTDAICSVLEAELKPQALAVLVQAQHLHLTSHPTSMTTSQTAGAFAATTVLQAPMHTALQEFCILLQVDPALLVHRKQQQQCMATLVPTPRRSSGRSSTRQLQGDLRQGSAELMHAAVMSILQCCNEDPSRQGLQGTAERYISSLLAATSSYAPLPHPALPRPTPTNGWPCSAPHRPSTPSPPCPPVAPPASPSPPESPSHTQPNGATASPLSSAASPRHAPAPFTIIAPCHSPRPSTVALASPDPTSLPPHDPPTPTNSPPPTPHATHATSRHLPTCNGTCHCPAPFTYAPAAPAPARPDPSTWVFGNATLTLIPPPPSLTPLPDTSPQLALLSFVSLCEHHMLPFHGHMYLAVARQACAAAVAPALLLQAVGGCTQRLQLQERITHQVANAVAGLGGVQGVLVVCSAVHMCMVARGVESHASSTMTVAGTGVLARGGGLRLELIGHASQVLGAVESGQ